jgi:hypothetical protein
MKTLRVITFLIFLPCEVFAQEIYKWEDEKGVIHYGAQPTQPAAKPFDKDMVPYSNTGDLPSESPAEKKARQRNEREEERANGGARQPRPSPTAGRPKAWLDDNGRLRLSGTIRNGGKGLCASPAVEVTVFDQDGSVDGNFATAAFPGEIARGEEAQFAGEYLTPVGDSLSWDVLPRCDSVAGVVYGAHKRGSVSLRQHRILRLKKFKTH